MGDSCKFSHNLDSSGKVRAAPGTKRSGKKVSLAAPKNIIKKGSATLLNGVQSRVRTTTKLRRAFP